MMTLCRLLFVSVLCSVYKFSCASIDSEFEELMSSCKSLRKKIEAAKCILQDVKHDQEELGYKYHNLKQYAEDVNTYNRVENLEIIGIPKIDGEDLIGILRNISHALAIPFNETHISSVWRKDELTSDNYYKKIEQQSIIVRFVSRSIKDIWLKKGRDKIVIPGQSCLPGIPGADVYINEHLNNAKKSLMKSAKRLEENGNISFAWLKDGHVYIRMTPGSKAIKIKSLKDLEALGLIHNM